MKLIQQSTYMKESSNLKASKNGETKPTNNEANSWRKGSVASIDKSSFTPFKRERFNSEGNTAKNHKSLFNSQQENMEEIEIDMSNVKYPVTGKVVLI
jgi:hypothetical protein